MQGPSWVALFRHIPANLHDSLALVTTTGTEVLIQKIVRLERDFLIVRGRMSGTMDNGRILILPYNQISNLAFNKRLTEPEVENIFAKFHSPATQEAPAPVPAAESLVQVETAPENFGPVDYGEIQEEVAQVAEEPDPLPETGPASVAQPVPAAPTNGARTQLPSKSILLARLRARLAGESK